MFPFEHNLKTNQIEKIGDDTYLITKWDWEYADALKFQLVARDFVQNNPKKKFFIFCNHPNVFTNGRGLQKGKNISDKNLIDFEQKIPLPFPLHQITRGGGLTFHHPGQLVFYPIVKLNAESLTLRILINETLAMGKRAIEKCFKLSDISIENELLGIWSKNQKLGSLGIAVERFVTFHGLAINLQIPKEMKMAMSRLHPCGLSHETYTDISSIINKPSALLDEFYLEFTNELKNSVLI
ncbi:MAG: lipoyl(octanoyl) transferase LipB [Bacteriovoracaceae bacterium]|nr:lipoyl(octanoyl) transferase LipB [Bacteriovoracaceae bacterium]